MLTAPPDAHAWAVDSSRGRSPEAPPRALVGPDFTPVRARSAGTPIPVAALLAAALLWVASTPPVLHAQVASDSMLIRVAQDSARISRVLGELRVRAQAGSPTLRAAQGNIDLAAARAAAAGVIAPAFLTAGLSEAPAGNLDQGNLRLEVGRDLMTGPRRRAERTLAEVEVRAATIALSLEERRLAGVVLRDAIRAAGARRIALRLAGEDQLLAGTEEGVRGRFSVGQARYVDVLRVRTERLRVQGDRSAAVAEERVARAGLAAVVAGTEPAGSLEAQIDTLASDGLADAWRAILPTMPSLDSLLALTEPARLDAVGAARTAAARALLVAEQRPQVSAYAGIQRIGQANDGPTLGPSVGITVSLPFTASRSNRLTLAAATQGITTAGVVRDAALVEARARLEAARERYSAARARLEVFDAALLRGARDERESALAAYRTGSLSLLELLDFERALSRAEIERIRALVDAADAWADLLGADESSDAHAPSSSDGR